MNPLRSIIIALASVSGLTIAACDTGADSDASETTLGANTVAKGDAATDLDPMLMATCHAADRDAIRHIEAALVDATVCKTSAECTVTVTETRCTGELAAAVASSREASFLSFVDRVDARVCSDVPDACAPPADPNPASVHVACIDHRCVIQP